MFIVEINNKISNCTVSNEIFTVQRKERSRKQTSVFISDILWIEASNTDEKLSSKYLSAIHYITRQTGKPKWKKSTMTISGEKEACIGLVSELERRFQAVYEKRPKRLLFLINPISGKATARTDHKKIIQPLFDLARVTCDVIVSERPHHFTEIISSYDWTSINGIAVMGGDGSFSEVMNAALKRHQTDRGLDLEDTSSPVEPLPVPIGLIPSGTGNVKAASLYQCEDILTAALHIIKGDTVKAGALSVYSGDRFVAFAGVLFCYGLLAEIAHHLDNYRWMRRARYVVSYWVMFVQKFRNFSAKVTLLNSQKNIISEYGNRSVEVQNEELIQGPFVTTILAPDSCRMRDGAKENSNLCRLLVMRNTRAVNIIRAVMYFLGGREENLIVTGRSTWLIPRKAENILIEVGEREDNPLNLIVNIDGEIHDITELKLLVRSHTNILTMFGSKT